MKTTSLLVSSFLLCSVGAFGQTRMVTLITDSGEDTRRTNQVFIHSFESAKLVSYPYAFRCDTVLEIIKDSKAFQPLQAPCNGPGGTIGLYEQVVVAGPATLRLTQYNNAKGMCTFEITPSAFPPDRTLTVGPSTNQTAVVLECSTNLVQWIPATNGVYGSPTEAKFFRIHAEKVP
jgi:hypothetical protein